MPKTVINLANWKAKKTKAGNVYEKTELENRIARIKGSVSRINQLMAELRNISKKESKND